MLHIASPKACRIFDFQARHWGIGESVEFLQTDRRDGRRWTVSVQLSSKWQEQRPAARKNKGPASVLRQTHTPAHRAPILGPAPKFRLLMTAPGSFLPTSTLSSQGKKLHLNSTREWRSRGSLSEVSCVLGCVECPPALTSRVSDLSSSSFQCGPKQVGPC